MIYDLDKLLEERDQIKAQIADIEREAAAAVERLREKLARNDTNIKAARDILAQHA